jgi:two-component sensor histidine kinase
MQTRIAAIAQLYYLISHSSRGGAVRVDGYLREIANSISASLLGDASTIRIEVKAAAIAIDPERAVPFGLLVNELATNAIKHAFPTGSGRVVLSAAVVGEDVELIVSDDGVGITRIDAATATEKRGGDYIAIFVRQLRGLVVPAVGQSTGTTVTVRFPLHVLASPTGVDGLAA